MPGEPVTPADRQLERLREQVAPLRILRAPWGWTAYKPGGPVEDDIQAKTLDELEARLAGGDP